MQNDVSIMTGPNPNLSETVARACALAEKGRVFKGYSELLEGLRQAKDTSSWSSELKALWYAAIEVYEEQWFPDEWLPLVKQGQKR